MSRVGGSLEICFLVLRWGVWFWGCLLFVLLSLGGLRPPVPELGVPVVLLWFPATELVFLGGSLIESVFCPTVTFGCVIQP